MEPIASLEKLFSGFALHHVGIVMPDFDAATEYMNIFGHTEDYRGFVKEFDCWCILCQSPPGNTAIELVVPVGGPLTKFNRGYGGLHHYALTTPNLDHLREQLKERSIELMYEEHVKWVGPFRGNFIGPAFTRGVIVEVVEPVQCAS